MFIGPRDGMAESTCGRFLLKEWKRQFGRKTYFFTVAYDSTDGEYRTSVHSSNYQHGSYRKVHYWEGIQRPRIKKPKFTEPTYTLPFGVDITRLPHRDTVILELSVVHAKELVRWLNLVPTSAMTDHQFMYFVAFNSKLRREVNAE